MSGPRLTGRWNTVTRVRTSKLTAPDVLAIRAMVRAHPNQSLHDVAARFSVSVQAIRDIVRRNSWRHLPDPPAYTSHAS